MCAVMEVGDDSTYQGRAHVDMPHSRRGSLCRPAVAYATAQSKRDRQAEKQLAKKLKRMEAEGFSTTRF